MEDILSAIEVIGAGRRVESERLALRVKMGFIAPFGRVETNVWSANLSITGIAVNCPVSLLSKELIDTMWTIELYLNPSDPQDYLSLVAQLVRVNGSGWVAFQFVRLSDEDFVRIESLIECYASEVSIEDPLDLTLLA